MISLEPAVSWTQIDVPGAGPSPRAFHSAIYDPILDQLAVYGGRDSLGLCSDVWTLPLDGFSNWNQLSPIGPAPSSRAEHSAVFDALRHRMIIYAGGADWRGSGDAWVLDLAGTARWDSLVAFGSAPPVRLGHGAVVDSTYSAMWVFGGRHLGEAYSDLWRLDLTASTWEKVVPAGPGPRERFAHGHLLDPLTQQHFVLGGTSYFSGVKSYLKDVWVLDLQGTPTWRSLSPWGASFAHGAPHAAFDPKEERALVFPGDEFMPSQGAWLLQLQSYSELPTRKAPKRILFVTPNPTSDFAAISFELSAREKSTLVIHDLQGRRIRVLVDENLGPGRYIFWWDGRDEHGALSSPGIYFCQLRRERSSSRAKIVFAR